MVRTTSQQNRHRYSWVVQERTVFRERQPTTHRWYFDDEDDEHFVRMVARPKDSLLLNSAQRHFIVQPHGTPLGEVFGMSDLCYVDERLPKLSERVREYIKDFSSFTPELEAMEPFSGEADAEHNARVEKAAVAFVKLHFKAWTLEDRQHSNCGWDLTFQKGSKVRHIEVKGRSVSSPSAVRLSPNEQRALERATTDEDFRKSYRLAMVHNALGPKPTLRLYRFDNENGWVCEMTQEALLLRSAGIFANPMDGAN